MTEQPAQPLQPPQSAPPMTYDEYRATLPAPAPAPKKKNRVALKAVGVLAVFVVGCLAGASGSHSTTVTVAPSSCRDALSLADQGFGAAAAGFTAASDGFTAIGNLDSAAATAATTRIQDANALMKTLGPQYVSAKADCLSH